MPEVPAEAVRLALAARSDLLSDRPDPTVLSEETLTRLMLEAAAPAMAEHTAKAIRKHENEHAPRPESRNYLSWRRNFRIAAQVASLAFSTEEDKKRLAAEALNRGDCLACPAPETEEIRNADDQPL